MGSANAKKILVVDDDLLTLSMMTAILQKHGYKVQTATNGATALKVIQKAVPDLVMLDIGMVPKDGYSVLESIRGRWGDRVHVVALTGRTEAEAPGHAGASFDGWIEKPFAVEDLIAKVREFMSRDQE